MPFVTVSSPANDVEAGVYEVALVRISDPRTVTAMRGPSAGKDVDLIDWEFEILKGPHAGKVLNVSSSTASGPKSKMYGFLTALEGGKSPTRGTSFEKSDLIGKMALATVTIDDEGWPRISNLSAMPASMLQAHFSEATRPKPQEAPQDLPF
jgi:hypothetical protein